MKLKLNFILLLFVAVLSCGSYNSMQAQVADQTAVLADFNGTLNVFGVSGTAPTYQIQGFFNHTTGRYSSSDVQIGDMIFAMFNDRCAMFEITAISSSGGGIISATVVDIEGVTDNFPQGITGIMRNTANSEYPLYVDGISGDLLACVRTHFTKLVDLSIASVNTDDQVVENFAIINDILSITVEGDTAHTVNLSSYLDNTDDQQISITGNTIVLEDGGTIDLSNYLDNTDEQTLAINSNMLSISNGNTVDLSPYLDDTDDQTLNLTGTVLGISEGNSVDLSTFLDNTDDQVVDVFTLVGNMLSLSVENDGEAPKTVDLSSYLDNTDNQTLTYTNGIINITNGNSIDISSIDTDTDDQTLSLVGNTLAISEGNSVDLSAYADNTDDQVISLTGNTLSLEDGGDVDLSNFLDNTDDQKIDEFQIVGNTLSISVETDGEAPKTVDLSSYLDNTDSQTLALAGNVLSITGGNSVDLSVYTDVYTASLGTEIINGDIQMDIDGLPLATLPIKGGDLLAVSVGGEDKRFVFEEIANSINTDNQNLTLNGDTLSIEDGNFVVLPADVSQVLTQTGSTVTLSDGGGSISINDADFDPTNEFQNLALAGNTLSISDGNSVDLSSLSTPDDQTLSFTGTTLSIVDGNSVDLVSLLDNTDEQTLALSGNTLSIANGNSVDLSGYVSSDDQTITLVGNTLTLEDGGTVDLSQYLDDTDTDDQTLSLVGNTLAISEGNSVDLSAYADNTDDQAITLTGNTLAIEDGGNVDLSGFLDNTDDQKIDVFTLAGNTLSLSLESDGEATKTVDLAAYLDNTDNQTLTFSANQLSISGGNTVDLSSYLDNTDNQNLTLVGNVLSIEDGNSVDLSDYIDEAVTVTDGNSVDFTLTGQDVTAEVIASPDAGNAVEIKNNGVYVSKNNFLVYTVGDATVRATGTGVTFTEVAGVGTLDIPAGVEVIDVAVNGTTSDLDGSNNYTIRIDETNSNYNTSVTDYLPPAVQVINTTSQIAGGPSGTLPFTYDEGSSPQRQVTSIGGGDVDVRLINLNAYSNWTIRINL